MDYYPFNVRAVASGTGYQSKQNMLD